MTGWIVFGLYAFGWLVALWPLYRLINDSVGDDDVLAAAFVWFFAAFLAAVWPFALVVALAARVSRRMWGASESEDKAGVGQ